MRVTVVPYDSNWPQVFTAAANEAASAMGENLLEIHHVGSTSIPGIHAKPIIDMLAVVTDLPTLDNASAQMEALGYVVMGEFGITGRRYFKRDNAARDRTHQIHAFQSGSAHISRHLAFRDFMRAHPELATQYSDLKRQLAEAHPNDINAYMDGKDEFIKKMQARALAWATQNHPI